jgi:hypothetical protein
MIWGEYVPDLASVRVYGKNERSLGDKELCVFIEGHKLVASLGDERSVIFQLPLDMDPKESFIISSSSRMDETCVSFTVRIVDSGDEKIIDFLSSFLRSNLSEDWNLIKTLTCRDCNEVLIDMKNFTPCLLPSTTWGFEDMRVCEECGPMVHHSHAPKRGKGEKIFVTDSTLYIEWDKDLLQCPNCDTIVSSDFNPGELETVRQRSGIADAGLVKVSKQLLGGDFMVYSPLYLFISSLIATEAGKKYMFTHSGSDEVICVNFLTATRDTVVCIDGTYQWASRVTIAKARSGKERIEMVIDSSLFKAIDKELNTFKTPGPMNISLLRVCPVIVEL